MKFTVLQSNFAKTLNNVSRVVATRTTLPVLSNILITAEKGKIKLSATDLEVAISSQTVGKIEEEGELTVPARLLNDFISGNTDESIEFTTEGNALTAKSARFEATINGISAEEFPTVPSVAKDAFCELEKEVFIDAVKKVTIAPANDETRPVLAGIYFSFNESILTLAATDSYRLAEKKIELENTLEGKSFIVPARTMNEVLRLLSGSDTKMVAIFPTDNQVAFKIGDTHLVSRLIEGAFPNYSQIIPTDSKIKVEVDFKELQSAMKMAALFAKESANNIKLVVEKDGITVKTMAAQTGNMMSKASAKVTGGELEIAFNVRYITDVLSVISGDKVIMKFNDGASSGVISPEKDASFIYIVMPLRQDK